MNFRRRIPELKKEAERRLGLFFLAKNERRIIDGEFCQKRQNYGIRSYQTVICIPIVELCTANEKF